MARSYDAEDIVQLPKLAVSGAISLGKSLITAAQAAGVLPASVDKAFARLKQTHAALRKAAQEQLPVADAEDSPDVREADRELDAAWSATYDWATGWSKLSGKANAATKVASAKTLVSVLFSKGLKFTQIKYQLEWAESQTRLDAIAEKQLDEKFEELGGAAFLKAIKAAHKAYGDILGMTKPKAPEADAAQVRKPLEEFLSALRKYVVCVTASADEDDKESVALAQKLLEPLSAWESALPQEKRDEPAPPEPGGEGGGGGRGGGG